MASTSASISALKSQMQKDARASKKNATRLAEMQASFVSDTDSSSSSDSGSDTVVLSKREMKADKEKKVRKAAVKAKADADAAEIVARAAVKAKAVKVAAIRAKVKAAAAEAEALAEAEAAAEAEALAEAEQAEIDEKVARRVARAAKSAKSKAISSSTTSSRSNRSVRAAKIAEYNGAPIPKNDFTTYCMEKMQVISTVLGLSIGFKVTSVSSSAVFQKYLQQRTTAELTEIASQLEVDVTSRATKAIVAKCIVADLVSGGDEDL